MCQAPACGARFPIVDGVPILIDDAKSLFSVSDYLVKRDPVARRSPLDRARRALHALVPRTGANFKSEKNVSKLIDLLLQQTERPRVLVIGGRTEGAGMEALLRHPAIELVETDVAFGPRTALVCDAHDIPFADGTFDAVIAQAVLEYLVDPYRSVEEIHRVLRPNGLVYAETPFIQQVHGGPYDFTRFTHLGHRRLFRRFAEVESGAVCGPAMALVWSYKYFLMSFVRSRTARGLAHTFAAITSRWLPYLDRYLIDRPATLDSASGYYFLGRRSEEPLSDRELVKLYRGLVKSGQGSSI